MGGKSAGSGAVLISHQSIIITMEITIRMASIIKVIQLFLNLCLLLLQLAVDHFTATFSVSIHQRYIA